MVDKLTHEDEVKLVPGVGVKDYVRQSDLGSSDDRQTPRLRPLDEDRDIHIGHEPDGPLSQEDILDDPPMTRRDWRRGVSILPPALDPDIANPLEEPVDLLELRDRRRDPNESRLVTVDLSPRKLSDYREFPSHRILHAVISMVPVPGRSNLRRIEVM